MYKNKFVACITAGGKVLREFDSAVYMPFGTEYEVLLQNLSNVRAVVHVYIDGELVTPSGVIVPASGKLSLERAIKTLDIGNRFKFIQMSDAIANHRGVRSEDGLVRIEFDFEQVPIPIPVQNPRVWPYGNVLRGMNNTTNISATSAVNCATYTATAASAGITAPGSVSTQKFVESEWFPMEGAPQTLVLQLRGAVPGAGAAATEPITVKHKPVCSMCGKTNKQTAKFCSECGTALELF